MTTVVELAHHRMLIPRWPGHGDLTIVIRDEHVYLRADQVERLAGIPPWAHGETLLGDTWPLELDGRPYYQLEDAVARCEAEATDAAAAFLAWLDEQLEQLLTDEVLDDAQRIPSVIGSHPVRVAARILDADPAVSIGQISLFAHLAVEGWIDRDPQVAPQDQDWRITPLARRHGWLTIRNVLIPAANRERRRTYEQIYVTPAGLAELRRTLHALHQTPPPEAPQPPLFD